VQGRSEKGCSRNSLRMLCVPLASLDGLVACPASPSRVPPEILSDIKKEAYISFVLFFYQSFFFTV
jgi:hypothetical protein